MAENKFAKSIKNQKSKKAIKERKEAVDPTEIAHIEESSSLEDEMADPELIKELFPGTNKTKTFNAHSLYLSDVTWRKLQRIAKKERKSISSVAQKIFDNVL